MENALEEPMTEEQRRRFFRQGCARHVPGYTGHCPTLKFRVGKRFGACTEDIINELIERKIFRSAPSRLNIMKENLPPIKQDTEFRRDWKKDSHIYKSAPYILGYTGYIPGFNARYGLTFMKAVEEGGKEWRDTQTKTRNRRDVLRTRTDRIEPKNVLSQLRSENVPIEIDRLDGKKKQYFDNQVTVERPPIVGYTGHIPGAKSHIALSKRYAVAARQGLELLRRDKEFRLSESARNLNSIDRALEVSCLDDQSGHATA